MSRIGSVPNHFDATFAATWGRETLARLTMPTLLMHGSETRASASRVAELLGVLLPQVECRRIDGAGHLGPMTHDALVNREIAAHLDRHAPSANAFGANPQLALT
jgi:pimeloyl-ACP methyl ester carboxylesterase